MKATAQSNELLTILVVDDYDDSRQMYAELLADAGYKVFEAGDGAEAIAKARELEPDLVIMDLSLPILDGWQATRQLKGDDRTRHIPILALTGHALEGASDGTSEEGWDGFLAKPCSPDGLLEAVHAVFARTRRSARKVRVRVRAPRRRASGS
jgi:two-component system cell cycle response regulator DivK